MFINFGVASVGVFAKSAGHSKRTAVRSTVAHLNFKNLLKFMSFIASRFGRVTTKKVRVLN